jgi:hypothetical protein
VIKIKMFWNPIQRRSQAVAKHVYESMEAGKVEVTGATLSVEDMTSLEQLDARYMVARATEMGDDASYPVWCEIEQTSRQLAKKYITGT